MEATTQRKYALNRIEAGDYLLPSNDGQTIWRIANYDDGPAQGLDLPRGRVFWGVWKWAEPVRPGGFVDTADWSRWELCSDMYETRREAIDAALQAT